MTARAGVCRVRVPVSLANALLHQNHSDGPLARVDPHVLGEIAADSERLAAVVASNFTLGSHLAVRAL